MAKNPATRVGDFAVATLWDGDFPCGIDVVPRAASEAGRALFRHAGLPPDGPSPEPINAFTLTRGGRLWLVDAGVGEVMPGFGAAARGLAALGHAPDAVDTIVLTHLHPDHIGGLIRDGARAYPAARLLIPEAEFLFWTDPRSPAASRESAGNFALARAVLDLYAGAVEAVPVDAAIASGLRFVPLPGHTPGHSGVMVEDGGDRLLIWADIVHSRLLQLAHPGWDVAFDDDPRRAAATRLSLLPDLVESGLRVGGSHLTGFGRIERHGEGSAMSAEDAAS